jgi:hypothetical protein
MWSTVTDGGRCTGPRPGVFPCMKVINHERQMGVNVEPAAAAKVFTQQRIRQVRDAVEAPCHNS